jgi:hypothetical protein
MLVDRRQLSLELGDPAPDAPAIGLELGLARAASPDPGTLLGQLEALATQAREAVPEQRELDLQGALTRGGVLGEDVEDERLPVDDVDLEPLLEVALLGGAQLVVEHHHVGIERPQRLGQLVGLPRADQVGRIQAVSAYELGGDRIGAGRVGEEGELLERTLCLQQVGTGHHHADEEGALTHDPQVGHRGGESPALTGSMVVGHVATLSTGR